MTTKPAKSSSTTQRKGIRSKRAQRSAKTSKRTAKRPAPLQSNESADTSSLSSPFSPQPAGQPVATPPPAVRTAADYLHSLRSISPDWRYKQAQQAVNHYLSAPNSSPPVVDPSVSPYLYFLMEVPHAESSYSHQDLVDHYLCELDPPKFVAYNVYQQHSRSLRAMLEARILAGQTDEEIEQLIGIPGDAVKAYAEMFFDVRPRLAARDWICSEVIGPLFQTGDQQWSTETIAKYFGYFGGPLILDAVMHGTDMGQVVCDNPDTIGNWLETSFRFKLKVQTTVMMTTYQPSRFDIGDLVAGYTSLASLELRERDLVGDDNILTQILETVKVQNPIILGDNAKFIQYGGGVYDDVGVVPRVSERRDLISGNTPKPLEKYTDPEYKGPLDADRTRQPNQPRSAN